MAKNSIRVNIPSTQVQRKFGDVVRRVYSGEEHFVVERDGLPVAAIIPMSEYLTLVEDRERQEQTKQENLKKFEEIARQFGEEIAKSGLTEEELMVQLEESRQQVYEETYGRKS